MADQRMRPSERAVQAERPVPVAGRTDTFDLIELTYRLFAGWRLIVCMALACALASGLVTAFLITPMYEATSTIYVLSRSDSAINMSDLQIGTALTSDYIKVFSLWEVHEEVISNLSLRYTYKEMEKQLSVKNDPNTRMLDITFRSPSAREAAAVANEYAKVASQYIADTMATDRPSMMSVALEPDEPESPSLTKNLLLALFLGAALACGIITVRMQMDDKYKTAEDIRKYTGLATLALVPMEKCASAHRGKGAGRGE